MSVFLFVTMRERLYNLLEVSDFDWTIFGRDLRNLTIYRIDLHPDPSKACLGGSLDASNAWKGAHHGPNLLPSDLIIPRLEFERQRLQSLVDLAHVYVHFLCGVLSFYSLV